MLKRAVIKAVVGTTVAAGAFVVPGVVAGGTQFALSADPSCSYATPATTTTSLTASPPAVQVGGAITGTATVDGPGTVPAGTMTVTAYPYVNGAYSSTGTVLASGPVSGANRTLNYSHTTTTGNQTYRIVATYSTAECTYRNSTSAPKYVSVYKYNTSLSLGGSGSTYVATVTAPNRAPDAPGEPLSVGFVRFTHTNSQGKGAESVDVAVAADGTASFTLPNSNRLFQNAQYLGNDFYNASNVRTTR